MIRALMFLPATGELRAGDETLVDAWRASPDALRWLDLGGAYAALRSRKSSSRPARPGLSASA